MKEQTNRPKLSAKTKAKIGFFAKVFAALAAAGESANKNAIYSAHGITTGSPIFIPKRTKFKGHMRNKSSFNKTK